MIFLVLVLLFGIFIANSNLKNKFPLHRIDFITSIEYTNDCRVLINTNSGYTRMINVIDVYSRKCVGVPDPVISPNGKFAAFSLIITTNTLEWNPSEKYEPYEYLGNSEYVYLISNNKWFKIFDHGAAETSNLTFLPNNNLQVDLVYEGKPSGSTEHNVEKEFKSLGNISRDASTLRFPTNSE